MISICGIMSSMFSAKSRVRERECVSSFPLFLSPLFFFLSLLSLPLSLPLPLFLSLPLSSSLPFSLPFSSFLSSSLPLLYLLLFLLRSLSSPFPISDEVPKICGMYGSSAGICLINASVSNTSYQIRKEEEEEEEARHQICKGEGEEERQ